MKLIIAGSRDTHINVSDIASKLCDLDVDEVVSGKCPNFKGRISVDYLGEKWAKIMGIPIEPFPANWNQYGKAAGPIRNEQMAKYADAVALFPGGRGTNSMFFLAKKYNLQIFDFRGE